MELKRNTIDILIILPPRKYVLSIDGEGWKTTYSLGVSMALN